MKLKIISSTEDLHCHREHWRNLLDRSTDKGVYLTYEWCIDGYNIFHQNDKMYVVILTDDQKKIVCIAPLVITKSIYRRVKVKKISFIKNHENPGHNFIIENGKEEDCIEIILKYLCRFFEWELIELQMIDIESQTGLIFKKIIAEKSCNFGTQSNRQSPYFLFNKSWEDFWESKSKKFKKSMRNKVNRVANQKNLTVEKILLTSSNAFEIYDMIKISSHSWKGKIGKDLASQKNNLNFYRKLCDNLAPKGAVYLWILKIDHIPVAYEFHIEHESIVYPLRADFDENYRDLSLGSILEYEIIKSLFKQGNLSEYHSCGHTYYYLINWTNKIRNYQNFEIFDKNLKMIILYNFEYRFMVMLRKWKIYHFFKKRLSPL